MTAAPGAPAELEAVEARRRLRRITVKVFAVQIATLVALWLLNAVYG